MQPIILNEPFRAVFYAPFYVAERRGLYARQGIEVRRDTAGDPSKAADNLLAGRADIAWSGPMRVMLLHARDAACPLKSFAAVVMKDPFYLMGAAPRPGFTTRDLENLRLGAVAEVPTPWWCLQHDIREAGLDPEALAVTLGPSMAENAAALRDGRLDVAQMFEPFASQVEAAGGAVWQAAADRGPTAYTALYATEARIAERGDEFAAMIRAIGEALAWIASAEPAEIAATIAPLFPDLPFPLLSRALTRYKAKQLWATDPRFPRIAFDRLRDSMASAGQLPRLPSFEECVDEAIVDRALAA
ncbi:ABC transporter substrate-binding protein [Roseomonas hellenica]|uniref:ABC transporter substrate-binding protein n=1 Tax=Plastoroseomonas hellenica TaxID=2687306 RepID=A0ABS5ET27_9PROT|nr:ABC transporter substrate-binding protein [Plastoroseomonas hellenica]MBR0663453.1 ABC transporter substrate-binding protein [Plastoroseomonas hellenica]